MPTRRPYEPELLPPKEGQQEFIHKMLTGSQKKTAHALRYNCEKMLAGDSPIKLVKYTDSNGEEREAWRAEKPELLNCAAFLTLTVGDHGEDGKFQQVWDSKEASRRINNLNRRILPQIFERAIVVTERHKNGAIHFHVLGILRGRPDIRTGFNFKAFKAARTARDGKAVNMGAEINYKMAASEELRGLWKFLRETLPGYGFGRAELTPIEKTGEAIGCYISKYIEKNVCNRLPEDRRKKLVRYIGWDKKQLKPNEFAWCTKRARAWRGKCRELCSLVNIKETEQAAQAFGPRWAFHLTGLIQTFDDAPVPFFQWEGYLQREIARSSLCKIMRIETQKGFSRKIDIPTVALREESLLDADDYADFDRFAERKSAEISMAT